MTWPTNRWPTSAEIVQRLRDLAADSRFSAICTASDLPQVTQENRTSNFVRIGRGSSQRNKVVITGGVHAREWAPPTAVTNLISALLEAFVAGSPITRGSAVRSADDVRAIINNVDLFVAPMINPDGYDFSQAHDAGGPVGNRPSRGWRKNRRPAPSSLPSGCAAADAIGVDINRNFDVLWDFDQFYVPGGVVQSSKIPCAENFIGSSAFSEVESRNVRFLLDKDPQFFVDVHMHGQDILHSWGVEENDPIAGPTPALNPGRVRDGSISSGPAFNGYKEPINKDFLTQVKSLANLMADATQSATGNRYSPVPGAQLVSISGAADDFSFSRNLGTSKVPIKAFTIECGLTFLPDFATEFPAIQREVQAALLVLLRNAASPPSSAQSPSSCRSCSVAN
jgi:Predicted carboxypeptidase